MLFWASSEIYRPANDSSEKVRHAVEPYINEVAEASGLNELDCKLRYIPIIMPDGMKERYPARSKLRKKEKVYDCSPQLNYEVFVSGTFEAQLREYLDGIAPSAPYLAELGASPEQVEEFKAILSGAYDQILLTRPDQVRH